MSARSLTHFAFICIFLASVILFCHHGDSAEVWIYLSPDVPGERAQMMGVADALGLPYQFKKPVSDERGLEQLIKSLESSHPKIVLVKGGQKSEKTARVIRDLYGAVVVKFAPGDRFESKDFDLVVTQSTTIHEQGNVLSLPTVPNSVNPEILESLQPQWQNRLAGYSGPYTTVLLGGHIDPKSKPFLNEDFERFLSVLVKVSEIQNGTLLILGSRRTPPHFIERIRDLHLPAIISGWNEWSDENPYLGYLSVSSNIITTGDSLSMTSEAIETGQPVFVFNPTAGFPRHQKFMSRLIDLGLTRELPESGQMVSYSYEPPRAGEVIAAKVKSLIGCSSALSID